MLMIEKCKNDFELYNLLEDLASNTKNESDKIWLNSLITYVFSNVLKDSQKDNILKILCESENKNMEDFFERIKRSQKRREKYLLKTGEARGKARGKITGKLEAIISTIKNMLKYNCNEEDIKKYTNATDKEIEQAKKELHMQIL